MEKKDPKPERDEERERQEQMARQARYGVTYILVGLVVLWLFQQFILAPLTVRAVEIPYSEFRAKLATGQILSVEIGSTMITGEMQNPDAEDQPASQATASPGTVQGEAATGVPEAQTVRFDTYFQPENDPDLVKDLQTAGVPYRFEGPASPVGAFLLSWFLPLALLAGF